MLNGTNHKEWVRSLMMNLSIMKIDTALKEDAPTKPTEDSTTEQKTSYKEWNNSNETCKLVILYRMDDAICDSIPKTENAKELLKVIAEKYVEFPKSEWEHYLGKIQDTVYDGVRSIRNHIS